MKAIKRYLSGAFSQTRSSPISLAGRSSGRSLQIVSSLPPSLPKAIIATAMGRFFLTPGRYSWAAYCRRKQFRTYAMANLSAVHRTAFLEVSRRSKVSLIFVLRVQANRLSQIVLAREAHEKISASVLLRLNAYDYVKSWTDCVIWRLFKRSKQCLWLWWL